MVGGREIAILLVIWWDPEPAKTGNIKINRQIIPTHAATMKGVRENPIGRRDPPVTIRK